MRKDAFYGDYVITYVKIKCFYLIKMKNKELYSGKELYKLALNLSQEYRPNKSSLDRRKRDSKFFSH